MAPEPCCLPASGLLVHTFAARLPSTCYEPEPGPDLRAQSQGAPALPWSSPRLRKNIAVGHQQQESVVVAWLRGEGTRQVFKAQSSDGVLFATGSSGPPPLACRAHSLPGESCPHPQGQTCSTGAPDHPPGAQPLLFNPLPTACRGDGGFSVHVGVPRGSHRPCPYNLNPDPVPPPVSVI